MHSARKLCLQNSVNAPMSVYSSHTSGECTNLHVQSLYISILHLRGGQVGGCTFQLCILVFSSRGVQWMKRMSSLIM